MTILLASEPMSMTLGILLTIAIVLLTLVLVGVGAYFGLRIIASVLNSRRDTWESIAGRLGMTVDRNAASLRKPMSGIRGDYTVTVSYFAVQRSENSYDDYAAVEVPMTQPIDFTLRIEKTELFYQKVADFFSDTVETGHDAFDKVFRTESSKSTVLNQLLNVEMLDGESPTLLTDLMHAQKRYYRVIITDKSVTLGVRTDVGETEPIEKMITKVIYLIDRFLKANEILNEDTRLPNQH